MSDKMREEFEAHCRAMGYDLKRYDDESGDYAIGFGGEAWRWWQASRQALVVELPRARSDVDYGYEPSEIIDLLELAGIKCK